MATLSPKGFVFLNAPVVRPRPKHTTARSEVSSSPKRQKIQGIRAAVATAAVLYRSRSHTCTSCLGHLHGRTLVSSDSSYSFFIVRNPSAPFQMSETKSSESREKKSGVPHVSNMSGVSLDAGSPKRKASSSANSNPAERKLGTSGSNVKSSAPAVDVLPRKRAKRGRASSPIPESALRDGLTDDKVFSLHSVHPLCLWFTCRHLAVTPHDAEGCWPSD